MIGPNFVATSPKHAWAAAVIVAAVLVAAACELPGAEHTAPPATTTPAARPAGTRLPPATVTAGATAAPAPAPSAPAVATLSPVASPEAARLSRAATPAIPGWVAARATRGAGALATARASATVQAEALATVEAWATAIAEVARINDIKLRHSACTTGLPMMPEYASNGYANYGGVRWTADGAHILLSFNVEVWALTADGSRVWRIAQARGQAKLEDGSLSSFGWMTSFDVTRDGKQVIYATCRYPPAVPGVRLEQLDPFDFDYELAVVGLDGQAPRRLTHHADFDNYPAWSPDGTRVAFVSDRGPDPWFGLYKMAADDPDVRRLGADLAVAGQPPAWSPDGRSIAVIGGRQGDEGPGLYLVHADGTVFARLSDAVSGGSWSPDGTRLAFAKPEGAVVMLYTIAADGSDARRVTTAGGWQAGYGGSDPRGGWIHTIAWSPDGSKLLYACGEHQFCVVTVDGAPVGATVTLRGEPVGEDPLIGERAVWSPDGARIAVARPPQWHPPLAGALLYSAAPDGSDRQILAWQGDGGEAVAAQAKDEGLAASRAACTAGFVVPAPDANPGLVRDCATLLAARAALFGGRLVNWGSGSPLDQWEGVTLAGAPPRVTGLDLYRKKLSGTIPPELGALDHLQRLSLLFNYLSGPIPLELGELGQLRTLWLGGNQLTGCIPVGLKRVPDNDLGRLGLPDCEARS